MTDLNQDLAALDAALYMGPTHGPWHATKPESHGTGVRGPAQVSLAWCGCATTVGEEGCYSIGFAEAAANAHFIAACSPERIRRLLDYIRALLDERDALEAENERLREDAERYRCLSSMATQQADYLGPIFRIDVRRTTPQTLFNFDAAVDHARAALEQEEGK